VPVQYSYTSTPPMGRTACTEPQCLYSTAIPLLPLWAVRPVQNLSACTVELYLYSPYWPYGLYRTSVPVQSALYLFTVLQYYGTTVVYALRRSPKRRYAAHDCSGISHFQYICICARFDVLTAVMLELWSCRALHRGDR